MPQRTVKGYLLLASAVITCPCHLPLLVALLAGTALGGVLAAYQGLVVLTLGAYFVLALVLALRWIGAGPCEAPAPTAAPKLASPRTDDLSPAPSDR